ncbi:hypothetical protein BKA66DRAFT_84869 [Pyrenochaeta sp. MPI-SDFR-AT-0127]|nr:hypothetical protein BKA66DRAFT_84869 [Pyrenochaeta sp. MPI-SDFR-AT-0127]
MSCSILGRGDGGLGLATMAFVLCLLLAPSLDCPFSTPSCDFLAIPCLSRCISSPHPLCLECCRTPSFWIVGRRITLSPSTARYIAFHPSATDTFCSAPNFARRFGVIRSSVIGHRPPLQQLCEGRIASIAESHGWLLSSIERWPSLPLMRRV